jgi:putative transposase
LVDEHGLTVTRACQAVRLSRTAYYEPPPARELRDGDVIRALQAVVELNGRWGFWKCFDQLRLDGAWWNPKRGHRVYCARRLNLPRRTRKRIPKRIRQPLVAPPGLNQSWAIDFMSDTLYDGRRFRTVTVIDEGNREALAIEVSPSLPSVRVIALLEELILQHGTPQAIRCDNGPEFTSGALTTWSQARGITMQNIQPGKPSQNAFMERFNRTYRHEILDAFVFESLADVRDVTTDFLLNYNTRRPHDSLGRVPPLTFLPRSTAADLSSYAAST